MNRQLIGILVALTVAVSPCEQAVASPTAVDADPAGATVTGSSPVPMSFPLARGGDLSYETWVQYRTEDGTAVAGSDYEAASGSLSMPAGETEAEVAVQALGAAGYSPDKQFALELGVVGVGPTPNFAPYVPFATGANSESVDPADVNGDGRADLLVCNSGDETISVLLNTTAAGAATPSFAAAESFAAGRGPRSAMPADVNRDGRPDVVVVNSQFDEHAISVLLNTTEPGATTPSFAARQVVAEGDGPRQVTAGDLNGDGLVDLVFSNTGQNFVSVLLNTTEPGAATVSFAPHQNFTSAQNSNSMKATDVNGDGRPDLVVAAGADDAVSVLLNTTAPGASSSSFAPRQDFPVEGINPRSVATGDVNGDQRPDLVVASLGIPGVAVLLNTTAPGAATPSFAPRRSFSVLPAATNESVRVADLNGDGRPEVLVASHNQIASVLLNTTPSGAEVPSFQGPQGFPVSVPRNGMSMWNATADINGDGRLDMLVANRANAGNVAVLMNTTAPPTASAPSFAADQSFEAGDAPSSVAAADVNGDGEPDLLVADEGDDTASVLLNTTAPAATAPSFGPEQSFAAGDAPSSISSVDVNGDGRSDLLLANEGDDTASVLVNTTTPGASSPSFAPEQSFEAGDAPSSVAPADVNGDGRPDLLVANEGDDTAAILVNTTTPGASSPSFAPEQSFEAGDAPSSVAPADVNGDGRPDLLVANEGDDTASVLLNTTAPGAATPAFATEQPFSTGDAPSSVAPADLNGDGRPDLLVANQGDDTASVLLNTTAPGAATPSFAAEQSFEADDAPSSVTATDVNGDGRPDLLVANEGDDTASVLLNTTAPGAATPSFEGEQSFEAGDAPSSVAATDLNGDGGPDLLASDRLSDEVSALLDTQYAASVSPASVTGTIHYAIPQISLEPRPLAFGEHLVGTAATETVTLSNTGGETMTLGGIAIEGADAGQFSQASSCPSTLAIGATCPISVTYRPSAAAPASATLVVGSDAPTGPGTVTLSGTGSVLPPPPGDGPPGGGPGGGDEVAPARLRIKRVRERLGTLTVAGTIATAARGTLEVKAVAFLDGRRVSAGRKARIRGGHWRVLLPLAGHALDPRTAVRVSARFEGSSGIAGGFVKRRLRVTSST